MTRNTYGLNSQPMDSIITFIMMIMRGGGIAKRTGKITHFAKLTRSYRIVYRYTSFVGFWITGFSVLYSLAHNGFPDIALIVVLTFCTSSFTGNVRAVNGPLTRFAPALVFVEFFQRFYFVARKTTFLAWWNVGTLINPPAFFVGIFACFAACVISIPLPRFRRKVALWLYLSATIAPLKPLIDQCFILTVKILLHFVPHVHSATSYSVTQKQARINRWTPNCQDLFCDSWRRPLRVPCLRV